MKIILMIFIISMLLTFGCEKDEYIFEPPPVARYTGSYEVAILNPDEEPQTLHQFIYWTFTDQFISCEIDTSKSVRIICDFSGKYILSDSLYFSNVAPSEPDCGTIYIPDGGFEFHLAKDENSPDTIMFRQVKAEGDYSVKKTIKLARDRH